jgi:hypothetical protein
MNAKKTILSIIFTLTTLSLNAASKPKIISLNNKHLKEMHTLVNKIPQEKIDALKDFLKQDDIEPEVRMISELMLECVECRNNYEQWKKKMLNGTLAKIISISTLLGSGTIFFIISSSSLLVSFVFVITYCFSIIFTSIADYFFESELSKELYNECKKNISSAMPSYGAGACVIITSASIANLMRMKMEKSHYETKTSNIVGDLANLKRRYKKSFKKTLTCINNDQKLPA